MSFLENVKKLLGFSEEYLLEKGGIYTASEITQQPNLWIETFNLILRQQRLISSFLKEIISCTNSEIILTGAGTSAFIGDVLQPIFQFNSGVSCKSIPTTSIVSHPELYFQKNKTTLLISFARSGNSPESCKVIELANMLCDNISHLVVTCNPDGKLPKSISNGNGYLIVLPPETNDKSLAMTSSFSSMLLCGILLSKITQLTEIKSQIELLRLYGEQIIDKYSNQLKKISEFPITRAVFLGSGPFEGIARESHLKLQELTDGKVICKYDTFLGFRHGPKAVIDNDTLIVYILSNDPYSQKYELDLIESVNKGIYSIAISEKDIPGLKVDLKIIMSENEKTISEELLTVASILPAQMLGFYKSLDVDLSPDSPSKSGSISRVVQGVKLYDYGEVELG